MDQTRKTTSSQQSDQWNQTGNGVWLPKHSKQARRQHLAWTQRRIAGKTLWDWISLLLVPLLVGIGTILVTNRQTDAQNDLIDQLHQSDQAQHRQDGAIAQQARWDDLLRQYRDGIDTLLLSHRLRQSHPGDDVSEVARARTFDVLKAVDHSRQGLVIAYLSNLKLIQGGFYDNRGVWREKRRNVSLGEADLKGADLKRADLDGADLHYSDLTGADLKQARLSYAYLNQADLEDADLHEADLHEADLEDAYLKGADLKGADLKRADLTVAVLEDADLKGARLHEANLYGTSLRNADITGTYLDGADLKEAYYITTQQLHSVSSLSGTTLPNGFHCKIVPNGDLSDKKKQAENRDACLHEAGYL